MTSRRRRAARVLAAVAVLLLLALWLARVPLARGYLDRELARRGVPARYAVVRLTPTGQRLEGVVVGDPARPDLVADWIETDTGIGLSGPYLSGVRAGRVRIAARLVGGRVSLGALDRLTPLPSGKPFQLPRLRVASDDVRVRLATSAGTIGLRLAGSGRLDDGFRGTLAGVAPRLAGGGCVGQGMRVAVALAIDRERPRLTGPIRLARLTCAGARGEAVRADLDATLGPALNNWSGDVRLATGAIGVARARGRMLAGTVRFAGDARATTGDAELTMTDARMTDSARAAAVRLDGPFRVGSAGGRFAGDLAADRVAVDRAHLAAIARGGAALAATPLAPLADRAARAIAAAARNLSVTATVSVDVATGVATLATLLAEAPTGARLALADTTLTYDWRRGLWPTAGALEADGGGLPSLRVEAQRRGAVVTGRLLVRAPYAAGGARLALTPVRFRLDARTAAADTVATLSGPLGDGRVEGLRLPVAARWAAGELALNPGCTPVEAAAVRVAGLALGRSRVTLCATGPALVRIVDGAVTGDARLPALRLGGRLGSSPLAIEGEGARIDLARRGFAVTGLRTRLGAADRETRLNFAALDGRVGDGTVSGRFSGGGGRIAAVPLNLGGASGAWRLASGALAVDGGLLVSDTAPVPRFQPMRADAVRLALVGGAITAAGTLVEPTTATPVATVAIDHALGSGDGHADLRVAGLTFGQGFQPELLTRLTFGVVADVRGRVAGDGRIAWGADGVTSTGRFRTDGIDLAAAFGPVTGIAGEIVFDDLLALATPPGQVATVKEVNPGIAVNDGTVRYRLLPGTRVAVEGARWPFAGGTLTLEPTVLDFGQEVARRMTFRVDGAAADQFLQQFAFDNLNATGTFDGVLPMLFDQAGGRIADGRLAVRRDVAGGGGGTIAYVGDLTQKDLGFWGNLAFQSLRSLRYRSLDVRLNGPLAGEMVTEVRFAGVSQGAGAKSNFLIRRLQRLPLQFNIRIAAPFRGLLDSVQSFYDPKRLIGRNLPALLDAQKAAERRVQPPASETKP